ncbi:excalibur calcium-binding domain-containing protein [Nostocoides sp. Soil756]|uniref:excalibur calcium-binding domain-containing protein n=1 Tax=Nostocoides sp. Soil756 TaxID=1736399 RepID=UPI000AE2EC1F|nr:excalibur calcium-binding domain-containing protein [Tetrasphaera sp. Soil756]
MSMRTATAVLATAAMAVVAVPAGPAQAATGVWKNCTSVQKKYPHGVGKAKAKDRTSGRPVTTFRRSDSLYAQAMRANKGLDRDKDGIACEKR